MALHAGRACKLLAEKWRSDATGSGATRMHGWYRSSTALSTLGAKWCGEMIGRMGSTAEESMEINTFGLGQRASARAEAGGRGYCARQPSTRRVCACPPAPQPVEPGASRLRVCSMSAR